MKRGVHRSPYFWAVIGVLTVVGVAWAGRENYQPVITGAVAPDFVSQAMDGSDVAISDYAGKVLLVNIWATWCAPCREEMPSMQRMYESLASHDDFEILAISVDAPLGEVDVGGRAGGDLAAFAEEFGLTFPILHNPAGDIQRVYQTTGVPESFVIGRDGLIYKKIAGPTDWDAEANVELVRRLLGQ